MSPQSGNGGLILLLQPHDLDSLRLFDGETEILMSQYVLFLISLAKYSTIIIIFRFFLLFNLKTSFSQVS